MRDPFVSRILQRVSASVHAKIILEPEFEYAGRIEFDNGLSHVFFANNMNINRAGSVSLCEDKYYTNYFLRQSGFKTPIEFSFFSEKLRKNLDPNKSRTVNDAVEFARSIGYPVIVKPNRGSRGDLVWRADTDSDIAYISELIFKKYDVALIQKIVKGRDYRLVVLGNEIISAYERVPLTIYGDGESSIFDLIAYKHRNIILSGRPASELNRDDERINRNLLAQGMTFDTILEKGRNLRLLDNANLSTGGDALDVTGRVNAHLEKIAISASSVLGLILCGVDVICSDVSDFSVDDYSIIELNASPGLDNYASIGPEQQRRVDDLYIKILNYLRANHS